MHALMENSSRDGCAFILDWLRTVVDSTVKGHSRSGFLVEHNSGLSKQLTQYHVLCFWRKRAKV